MVEPSPSEATRPTALETGGISKRSVATYATSSECFLDCSACLAAARFTALGPLFFFLRRAASRSDLESFGALGMSPSIPLTRQAFARGATTLNSWTGGRIEVQFRRFAATADDLRVRSRAKVGAGYGDRTLLRGLLSW